MQTVVLMVLAGAAAACWMGATQDDRSVVEPPPVRVVAPHDDAGGDASFLAFRARALKAADTCSQASLQEVLASGRGPGDDTGDPSTNAFWRYWTVDAVGGVRGLCRALSRALTLGAVRWRDDLYCAPYVSCPGGLPTELPFGRYLIGVVERTEIRAEPADTSGLLAAAPYPPLIDCRSDPDSCNSRGAPEPPDGWMRVRLGAYVGYVSMSQIRDQHEPSLEIRRLGNGWRITRVASAD